MDKEDGLSRELSAGGGANAAQTRFPIADNFFTYRRLIEDTHQDGKNKSSPCLLNTILIYMKQYRPLHDSLTIKESKINGLGVFASKAIPKDTYLGITHVDNTLVGARYFPQSVIRTPLGGFLNHSENPNCFIEKSTDDDVWRLVTLLDIPENTEIQIKYFSDFLTF